MAAPGDSRRAATDPWLWVCALAPLALFAGAWGAPFGVAVAEDFDFLHRALLEPSRSWLDGGGSQAFWRPVAHQLYYRVLGPLILSQPAAVAALHGALLALATVLVYRVLRRSWSGPLAAAAATFPLLSESTRTLVIWPSHFVDLGLYLFSAIALFEASRRRLATALAALLAALLCKELAVVTAALIPFLPRGAGDAPARGERARWMLGAGLVVVAWAAASTWVRAHAGLELPHALERDPGVLSVGPLARLGWALGNAARAIVSLSLAPGPWDLAVGLALAAIGLATLAAFARDRAARARLCDRRGWIAWGAAWAIAASATLIGIFPLWSPNRSHFAASGAGVAVVAVAGAAHPAAAAALVAVRAAAFALGPRPARGITPEAEDRGAFNDVPRITRLQRLMLAVRAELSSGGPPAPGTTIGVHQLPLASEYAFGGDHALRVWFRDTTLLWVPYERFRDDPDVPVSTWISYQPPPHASVVRITPAALRAQAAGVRALQEGRWEETLAALDRADSLQADPRAAVFRGDNAGRRAYALAALRRPGEAEAQARVALEASGLDVGARFVLALTRAAAGDSASAWAQLDTLLAQAPDHEEGLALRRLMRGRGR